MPFMYFLIAHRRRGGGKIVWKRSGKIIKEDIAVKKMWGA
jgi:hypothetical protein